MAKDNIRQMRTCRCRNFTKYSGHHVVNVRTFYQHFKRAKELGDFRDFSEEVITAMATDAPLPTETPTSTPPPPQTMLKDGQTANTDMLDELYDSSHNESDEEGDACNIQNWVDEVDNAFDVFGMDPDDYHLEDPSDGNTEGVHQEDPDEINDILKYMELHRFYRQIGRRSWRDFQRIMDVFYQVRIQDGDTYGRKLRHFVDIPTEKIDRCRFGHMAFTGGFASETKCVYKVNQAFCGEERYQPKVNVDNPDEARIAVSQLDYIPLRMRLVAQFSNAARAQELQTYSQHRPSANMTDWTDGRIYRRLKGSGYFTDGRDLALQMSLDEITLTGKRVDKKLHKVMVVFIYLLNLHPRVRFNKSNTLLSTVIPSGYDNSTIDTFLQPLMDECRYLSQYGVPAVDASRGNAEFTLKAHLVLVTGDGRAVAKAMGMKEPGNTLYPCRACEIKASRDGTTGLYIPHTNTDINKLPIRQNLGTLIDNWTPSVADSDVNKGISRRSLLRKIPTLYWPESFPVDTMHCIAHNLTRDIFRLLWGTKWSNSPCSKNVAPYCVSHQNKIRISNALRDAKSTVPAYVAPPLREIGPEDIKQLKTAEWKALLLVYGPAIMQGATERAHWLNLLDLSRMYGLLLNHTLRPTHIKSIGILAARFVRQHEKLYYTDLKDSDSFPRIQVCTLQRHSLLHLVDDVLNWGPASIFAQWLPEGYLGYIKKEADSPPHMIRSLIDGVLDDDRYNIALYSLNKYNADSNPVPSGFTQEKTVTLRRSYMTKQLRQWITSKDGIPGGSPLDVRIYGSYRMPSGALITTAGFQRTTSVNRKNCYISYRWSVASSSMLRFGEVQCFAQVTGNETWGLAYVLEWKCVHDSGCYTKTGNLHGYWFEARLIVGLVGLVSVKVRDGVTKQRVVGKDGIYNEAERDLKNIVVTRYHRS